MMFTEKEIIEHLESLPEGERNKLIQETVKEFKDIKFVVNQGPQTDAYYSEADILLFGGSPGGGKSTLGVGLALNEHYRSLIVRKNFADLTGIIDTAKKIVGSTDGFIGGARPEYRKPEGGVIHFVGMPEDGGIGGHQGVDHDFIYIDEAATLTEAQVRLLAGWLRTDKVGQRKRIVLGSNPPMDSTGDWMIVFFAPWLDDTYPNPAKPGELRYFLPDEDGKDRECDKDDHIFLNGVKVMPTSRTFIPSSFTDNPYYNPEEYAKQLAGLPDDVREILTTGNFMLTRKDGVFQTIPTAWVKAAMERWTPRPPDGIGMSSIGVDVASGGSDNTVLACRYDGWYDKLVSVPGKLTPLGSDVAALVVKHRRDGAAVIMDMGGGYGGSPKEHLQANEIKVTGYKGNATSYARSKDDKMGYFNVRSQAYWEFRNALNPDQVGGSPISLPNDTVLLADLTAPRFEIIKSGIKVEPKDKVCETLGRSPDRGDAVVMGWYDGVKGITNNAVYSAEHGGNIPNGGKRIPKVNLGRDAARRTR